jgi:hypothetical protein
LKELQEAYDIRMTRPDLYTTLVRGGEVGLGVRELIRLRVIADRHRLSILELMKSPPWLVDALERLM